MAISVQNTSDKPSRSRRVLVLGATGTIGRAAVRSLLERGHEVVCLIRRGSELHSALPTEAELRFGDVTDPQSVAQDGICGEHFDAIVSCLASRTGAPADAWAIDHAAHVHALAAAKAAGIGHFVLLSAICVQKPKLEFQHAKLAFEQALIASGLTYSIVRPTAFFKSLSGQVERVSAGKAFLVFGDGELTACKPISDRDAGDFLAGCLDDADRHDRVLPIGGPGSAMTPREQGEILFELTGKTPKFRHVPVRMLDAVIAGLSLAGRAVPKLAQKAELARIGRYYATESMLVLDPVTGRYDASATPSTGSNTLREHYARLISGEAADERGAHAVF
jgi:divinyl chlorophyllide a 8-vinyl-reductase